MRTFTSDDEVWDVIHLIIEETKQENLKGNKFDIAESMMSQLPFFTCTNIMLNRQAQKDIAKFVYSKDFGVSPHKGSYGEQPQKWVDKAFTLKNLIDRQKMKAIKDGQSNGQ